MTEAKNKKPQLFISYCWTSPEHEEWVLKLGTELIEDGVTVILDKWDLKEGQDAHKFMEQMVANPDVTKVAIICDKKYAEKANNRSGGVGVETQIISPEVYAKADQTKFVAVIAERDDAGQACVPVYYSSRKYIDLSSEDSYAKNYEQLLRWVYDKPMYVKPPPGKTPAFISEQNAIVLATSTSYRRAIDAIHALKPTRTGAIRDYFERLVEQMEAFRIVRDDTAFDDQFVGNIEQFIPYRNEAIEIFLAISQYDVQPEIITVLHRFFEQLLPYFERPAHIQAWTNSNADNFRFITHELFIYAVAALLKYENFTAADLLLRTPYYYEPASGGTVSFERFRSHLTSLDERNVRLKLHRMSIHGDLLRERAVGTGISFDSLAQADFLLFIRDGLDCLRVNRLQKWWPETMIYLESRSRPFEIFARATSSAYFERVRLALGIERKEDLVPLVEAFLSKKFQVPGTGTRSLPMTLMNSENLATKP
jgi:hypothetical protein